MPVLESAADQRYQHSLPTVSFRIIDDDKALLAPAGVHSEQSRSYGYNDFSDFERPEFYIRYIEPIEAELKHQVEYDMDEQDQAWLDAINAERKKDQSGPISYEVFEIIVDKLEKEWFELIKRIPKPESHLPVEDSRCAICDDPEGENSNAIVFCDGCNLAVHQDCYGVPYIPEGQWLCRKCTVSPENPVSCLFCPSEGGAFKQTTTGHWAHLLCSIWIPEVTVGNAIYMEPVDGVDTVPKSRWKLLCSLCRERVGACIQCDNKNCFVAFHVTCARQMGLLMSMKSMGTDGQLRAFCEKHLPVDSQDDAYEEDDEDDSNYSGTPVAPPPKPRVKSRVPLPKRKTGPVTTKSARAHAKSYRPGPPIVPQIIVKTLLDYVAKFLIRKRQPFVERLCRYWSLKREARRGAPLLKRLHLEPWTASSASKQQTDAEKATKLKFLTMLRNDLEKVRLLAELVRKREKDKLRQTQLVNDVVDQFIFPYYGKLRLTLERISAMDRQELFLHPINRTEVPDYYEVVKEPMCWLFIDDKIEKNKYLNVEEFKHDINLVLDNAILYNAPETTFTRIAKRIKANSRVLLDELDSIPVWSGYRPPSMDEEDVAEAEAETSGDLEPSLVLLSSLLAKDPNDTDKTRDHLEALFSFELEKPRVPTPPPAQPKQRKYMSAAERKQRWDEREAMAKERVASRSSRAAAAATKAFEQEAGIDEGATPKPKESSKAKGEAKSKPSDEAESSSHATHASHAGANHGNRVGVVGYETYAILSDRERRAQEKNMDLVTEDVGNQDLFKRFNVGWVLPEGSKRRRSDRPPEPAKPIHQTKAESIKATTLHDEPPSSRPSSLTPVPSSSSSMTESLPEPTSKGKGRAVETTTRNKRKEPDSLESSKTAKKRKGETGDKEARESARPPSMSRVRRSTAAPVAQPKRKTVTEEDPYPPSTLVWAKLTSYPYFPAEIIDQTDDDPTEIPPSIFANRAQAERDNGAAGKKTWLVRFFDAQASYGWIPANRLDLLGENNALDEMYLAGKEKTRIKGFKTSHLRTACRKAYREALAQMEIEEEEE